jgi:hypothetical protein
MDMDFGGLKWGRLQGEESVSSNIRARMCASLLDQYGRCLRMTTIPVLVRSIHEASSFFPVCIQLVMREYAATYRSQILLPRVAFLRSLTQYPIV